MVIKQMSQTPLMLACQALDVEMVELLIQRGADVQATDQKGYSVLHYAVWSQQEPWQQQLTLLKYLRKHGPDSHGNGNVRSCALQTRARVDPHIVGIQGWLDIHAGRGEEEHDGMSIDPRC
eukprot:TRINITY_DN12410_c0_g2_i8.p1 TRINITY_DN12410_c0_g2~~TRINITY_DN12410_c0_g2_i8.p1  ORF type:complete len:121 (+),score=15.50 TRINITY_DN12410_c0_g2_i8:85-447(+)